MSCHSGCFFIYELKMNYPSSISKHIRQIFCALLYFWAVLLWTAPYTSAAEEVAVQLVPTLERGNELTEEVAVYFYSSETNINNFKLLKMEFDEYFKGFGPVVFQPFKDRETFEAHVKNNPRGIFLISSWHFRHIRDRLRLTPILVGAKRGRTSQKRLLVTNMPGMKANAILKNRIASASSILHTKSTLTDMLGRRAMIEKARILTVPKDMDALMSVGFGMSRSALTTDISLEKLKSINPGLHGRMEIAATGADTLRLIVAVPESFKKETESVVKFIQNMSTTKEGRKKIKMLGLDEWVPPANPDLLKLVKK